MKREFDHREYFQFFMIATFIMVFALNLTNVQSWNYMIVGTLIPIWLLMNYIAGVKKISANYDVYRKVTKIMGNFILFSVILHYIGGYTNVSYTIFHFFMILSTTIILSPFGGVVALGVSFFIALKMVFAQSNILNSLIIHSYVYGGALTIGLFIRIEKARKRKLDHKVKELEALYKISKMIDHFPGTEEILDNITTIVAETIRAAACLVMLYDEEKDLLVAKAGYGLPKETLPLLVFKQGEGIERKVIESRGRITCGDISGYDIYQSMLQNRCKADTVTAIPLYLKNKVIGTLSVYDRKGNGYSLEDIELLDMMGSRIGMILENDNLFKQLRTKAIKDGLTGLYNHKQFYDRLKYEVQVAKDTGHKVYLLMIDIDRFKVFNDQYGHLVGDKVLIQIARTISSSIRETDYAARYGGEEFTVILPDADYEIAARVADRIRNNVKKTTEEIEQLHGKQVEITVSIGISCYPNCTNDITNLVDIADVRMYKGKAMGGDQVIA